MTVTIPPQVIVKLMKYIDTGVELSTQKEVVGNYAYVKRWIANGNMVIWTEVVEEGEL